MKIKIQQKLTRRERRLRKRIDRKNWSGRSPMIAPPKIQLELAERVQALNAGGLGVVQELVKQLKLAESINERCPIFKLHLPYSEADHVLNIAYNLLAGGGCLEHLELRRQDEAYLEALGAERIPDPTTAGDFCRRFGTETIVGLQEAFHEARLKVWRQQPQSFFDLAIIEGDGTMVETDGQRKEGIGVNYKGQWGYHPLVITLAHTREVLYLCNRSGNRPSHETAFTYFDRSIALCRRGGFRKIRLRGDTDFSQTEHLDRWHNDQVEFVFGMDAMKNLVKIADNLPKSAWERLRRKERVSANPRARRRNAKEQIVIERQYKNKQLQREFVAEFAYRPNQCRHTYRMIVLRKEVRVSQGQQKLFDDSPYFFYLTNIPASQLSATEIVAQSNQRCDQENIVSQLKQLGALSAPLHSLESNWAYMVMATLAWNLKSWLALSLVVSGSKETQAERRAEKHSAEKHRLLRMDFSTFRQSLVMIPAQIVRGARYLTYRLLTWTPALATLFHLYDCVSHPLLN